MSKILAIDTGTNSLGIAVRNTESDNNDLFGQFTHLGVTIFPKGVGTSTSGEFSIAAARTKIRSARRLRQARKYRIWKTLDVLIKQGFCPLTESELNKWRHHDKSADIKRAYPVGAPGFEQWVKLDFNGDGKPDYTNPYELRKEMVTTVLDFSVQENRYKLGRALYHIAQRRGFRSSKGETIKEQAETNDEEVELKKSEEIKSAAITQYIKENNITPEIVCVALAHIAASGNRVRNDYQIIRSQYESEVKYMFEFQGLLTTHGALCEHVQKALFFQHKPRSQKGLVGKCTLEAKKFRCPIGHYEFEEFRAWSLLNNIKCDGEQLSLEQREALYEDLFIGRLKSDFKFGEIREWLQTKNAKKYDVKNKTINYKDETSVSACPVSARLRKLFGDDWKSYSCGKYTIDDIWHILFTIDDAEWIEEFATNTLKFNDKERKSFNRLNATFPDGYSMLSHKAIVNINRFLRKGLIYTDAVFMAKLPDIFGEQWNDDIKNEIFGAIRTLSDELRAKRRIYNIVNSLIATYKALADEERYAHKDMTYKLDKDDYLKIEECSIATYGDQSWGKLDPAEQRSVIDGVAELYQQFFADIERKFLKLPQIGEAVNTYIMENYGIPEHQAQKLYHPSKLDYYAPAAIDQDAGIRLLGSPIIGAFKNPVATRSLFQIRNAVNDLLKTGVVDESTRVVIELSRDLNDSNMRKAIAEYNREKEKENKAILKVIQEYYSNDSYESNDAEIDKVRLWVEQWDITETGSIKAEKEPKVKGRKRDLLKKDELATKIKLWREQQFRCVYTGRLISISDLLNGNVVDIEHTIPQSILPDNSLANKTVCYADFNRNVKKNRIPAQLDNYDTILHRITPWRKRIEKLEDQVMSYRVKAKHAPDKETKDAAIVQKHLWQMHLDYWHDKVERFMIMEVSSGFRHSQLVDNRIISRYAVYYLKSLFQQVEVQKGSVVSDFRKMLGVQSENEKKDRSLHSHHAIDAAILSLIPKAPARDKMLELYYKIQEAKTERQDTSQYERQLIHERKLHGIASVGGLVDKIESSIFINHKVKDVALNPPACRERKLKGKMVVNRGDSIRGKLHDETYYGAIKPALVDDNGEVIRDSSGQYRQQDEIVYVVRKELRYKNGANDSGGFSSVEEIKAKIVNPSLGKMIEKQVVELFGGSLKDALASGVYVYNKRGELAKEDKHGRKINPIRHIRCKERPANPIALKAQTYTSKHDYKKSYYVQVGDLYCVCRYDAEDGKVIFKAHSLYEVSENRRYLNSPFQQQISVKGKVFTLSKVIKKGAKVLIHSGNSSELYDMSPKALSNRLYVINRFETQGPQVHMTHHLIAKSVAETGRGTRVKDINDLPEKIRCAISMVKCLYEGDDFEFTIDGQIKFKP